MDSLKQQKLRQLLVATEGLLDSMNAVVSGDGDGPNNLWKYAGYKHQIRKYNQIAIAVRAIDPDLTQFLDQWNEENIPSEGNTVPSQQKEFFVGTHSNLSMLKSILQNALGVKDDQIKGLVDFFRANLRKAIREQPTRELEVQDYVEALLIGRGYTKGLDYDREAGAVKYSHKHSIPDFILKKLSLAIEIKFSPTSEKSRKIVDEINADILAYGKMYSKQLFIVYDIGSIRDETEFTHDLESVEGVYVIVVKH